MGNQPHQKIQTDVQQHQRLGLIKFLQPPQSQDETQMIQIQRPIHSEKFYLQWVEKLKLINHGQGRQLFYFPQKFNFDRSGLCGISGNVQMQFEYFPFLLKNEIKNRRNLNQYFDQTQIWYLLYKMVQAEAIFQKIGMKIGDFNPKSILLNQNGQIRIISQLSLPGQNDNFTKITQHNLAQVYLAPEEISHKDIEKAIYPHGVNSNKAQIFCIGITLLQAATLEDCNFLFTRNPLKIQTDKLQRLKNLISQRYSAFLCQTLKQMTDIDPNRRKTGQQISYMLRNYEDTILELQSFCFSNIQHPSSIEKSAFFNHGVGSGLKKNSMIVGPRKGVN